MSGWLFKGKSITMHGNMKVKYTQEIGFDLGNGFVWDWGGGWGGGGPTITCLLKITGVGATIKCYFGLMKHLSSKLWSHRVKSLIFRNIN